MHQVWRRQGAIPHRQLSPWIDRTRHRKVRAASTPSAVCSTPFRIDHAGCVGHPCHVPRREQPTDGQDARATLELAQELRGIREVLDEIREDITWAIRNVVGERPAWRPIQPLTSMPLDPLVPDFGARVNRLTAADLPDELQPPEGRPSASTNRDSSQPLEQPTYCCDDPRLEWLGDPDSPAIVCANCAFVVADGGEVLASKPHDLPDPQQTLF